jgi:hypothetical protein
MKMNGIKVKFYGNVNWLENAGYTIEEEAEIYDELLQDVYNNPRWYLDTLHYLPEFRVSWVDYKKQTVTKPYKFVIKNKKGENDE